MLKWLSNAWVGRLSNPASFDKVGLWNGYFNQISEG